MSILDKVIAAVTPRKRRRTHRSQGKGSGGDHPRRLARMLDACLSGRAASSQPGVLQSAGFQRAPNE
jgi:hypothetical protein